MQLACQRSTLAGSQIISKYRIFCATTRASTAKSGIEMSTNCWRRKAVPRQNPLNTIPGPQVPLQSCELRDEESIQLSGKKQTNKPGLLNKSVMFLHKENKVYFLLILRSEQLYLSICLSMYLSVCFY